MEGGDDFKESMHSTWFHRWTLEIVRSVPWSTLQTRAAQHHVPHARDILVLIRFIVHVPSQTGKVKRRKQFLPHSNYKPCWEWEAGEMLGRRAGPWESSPWGLSRQGLGGSEGLQRWNLHHYFLCFTQTSLGRSSWWWMEVKESQDLPIIEIKVVEVCVVHCRMGTGRLRVLTRTVSLGNTCCM